MSHSEWLERADLYALGALDGEELNRFEDHIDSGCEACDRQVREAREASLLIPRSLPRTEGPSPEVRRRLMEQIAVEAPDLAPRVARPRAGRGLHWGRVVLAASVALLVGLAGLASWDSWNLRGQLRDITAEAGYLRTQLVQRKDLIRYLEDPEVAVIPLAGLPPSPRATGRVLWNASDRSGYLLARGLPPAPAGKKYAVWAIAASNPVLAGLFSDEEMHRARFRLSAEAAPKNASYREFAVTLEPATGGPQPTGPMHLRGTLTAHHRTPDLEPGQTMSRTAATAERMTPLSMPASRTASQRREPDKGSQPDKGSAG